MGGVSLRDEGGVGDAVLARCQQDNGVAHCAEGTRGNGRQSSPCAAELSSSPPRRARGTESREHS